MKYNCIILYLESFRIVSYTSWVEYVGVFPKSRGKESNFVYSNVWTFLNKQREHKPSKTPMENYVEIAASSRNEASLNEFMYVDLVRGILWKGTIPNLWSCI